MPYELKYITTFLRLELNISTICTHVNSHSMYCVMFGCSELVGRLPLTSLLLPGTHNSGCYEQGLSLSPGLARFLFTQDHDVYTQLVFGVRYIDLRIGVFPVKNSNSSHGMDLDKRLLLEQFAP